MATKGNGNTSARTAASLPLRGATMLRSAERSAIRGVAGTKLYVFIEGADGLREVSAEVTEDGRVPEVELQDGERVFASTPDADTAAVLRYERIDGMSKSDAIARMLQDKEGR